ncbi:hypothetical protein [Maribacter sp. IgM3_T14_3]|uniref:hypothetical protein n=1 Tax=Maribacter sp. IgM3_T14_3 TaxID=3415140 RepID=UPI003C6F7F80
MKFEQIRILFTTIGLAFCVLTFIACNGCSTSDNGEEEEEVVTGDELIQESFFNATPLTSFEKIDCTLEDGTVTECYQITFSANPANVTQGPYCPEYADDTVSLTIYDGTSSTGFQVVTRALFEAMEVDGFDIIDNETGEVHDADSEQRDDWKYCLGGNGVADVEVNVTYIIPASPKMASSNNVISTTDFDLVGLSLDGIPIAGDPPSIYDGPGRGIEGGNIPALRPLWWSS